MESKINASELSALLALATGKGKDLCEAFIRQFTSIISEELEAGENVRIKGFGSFKLLEVEARKSVNVSTGEEYEIPSHRRVVFVPTRELASAVNAPFEVFEAMEIADVIAPTEEIPDPDPALTAAASASTAAVTEVPESALMKSEDSDSSEKSAISDSSDNSAISDSSDNSDSPDISDSSEAPSDVSANPSKFRFAKGFLVGFVVALAVVSCLVVIGYYSGLFHREADEQSQNVDINSSEGVKAIVAPADTTPVIDTTNAAKGEVAESQVSVNVEESEKDDVPTRPSDSEGKATEKAPVYDTVSTTRYLTIIAKEHYGNFNLWPIIYEENAAILGHPDRIKPGTRVVVPPLSKYNIDPNNQAQIKEIKRKGVAIYARFKK